jgi:antibiotic biosynthesis monooxygenase (ABM) superfamily enzyme
MSNGRKTGPGARGASGKRMIYEVNIEVDAAAHDEYRAWLQDHIAEILTLPGFTGAKVFEALEPPPSAGRIGLCVHYALKDRASLDDYLRDHAPRLRADGVSRFGDRFHATRRILRAAR